MPFPIALLLIQILYHVGRKELRLGMQLPNGAKRPLKCVLSGEAIHRNPFFDALFNVFVI